MRLKIEAFCSYEPVIKSVIYVPQIIRTIRDLQDHLVSRFYSCVPPYAYILLTLDGFALQLTDPIDILSSDDKIRIDVIVSNSPYKSRKDIKQSNAKRKYSASDVLRILEQHPYGTCALSPKRQTLEFSPFNVARKNSSQCDMESGSLLQPHHVSDYSVAQNIQVIPDVSLVDRNNGTKGHETKEPLMFENFSVSHAQRLQNLSPDIRHKESCRNNPSSSVVRLLKKQNTLSDANLKTQQKYATFNVECNSQPDKPSIVNSSKPGKSCIKVLCPKNSDPGALKAEDLASKVCNTGASEIEEASDTGASEIEEASDTGASEIEEASDKEASETEKASDTEASESEEASDAEALESEESQSEESATEESKASGNKKQDVKDICAGPIIVNPVCQNELKKKIEESKEDFLDKNTEYDESNDDLPSEPVVTKLSSVGLFSIGDHVTYCVATLHEGCPSVGEEKQGEIVGLESQKTRFDENVVIEIHPAGKAPYFKERYLMHDLFKITHAESVSKSSYQTRCNLEHDSLSKDLTKPYQLSCDSYTQNHPVLGEIVIPSKLCTSEIERLIHTKLCAVRSAIRRQIDFYFSSKNYPYDKFLRAQEDSHGWIPLKLIANFNRIKKLTHNVKECASELSNVELSPSHSRIRRLRIPCQTTQSARPDMSVIPNRKFHDETKSGRRTPRQHGTKFVNKEKQ